MDELCEELFGKIPKSLGDTQVRPINLRCITALESADTIALVANNKVTGINTCLLIHKKDSTISFSNDISATQVLKRLYFSLFMGFFIYKGGYYIVFCDKAKSHMFGRYYLHEISSVVVYSIDSFSAQIDLSITLTEYFKLGFLFSYDFDLTDSGNYMAAFDKARNPFQHRKNFLYFANKNLISTCITSQNKEWVIPTVYGHFHKVIARTGEFQTSKVFFIYKASMLDVNTKYKKDEDLLEDFYCPSSFHVIDTFILEDNEVKAFGVVFNDFPGTNRKMKIKSKGDYFSTQTNPRRVRKYFEFMRYFQHCHAFVFSGKKECVEPMRAVREYRQTDPDLRAMIKIFIALKSDGYQDLLDACKMISDRANAVKLFESETDDDSPNFLHISFCTERTIDEMEECFYTLYQGFLKNENLRKKVQSKRRRRLSSDDIIIDDCFSIGNVMDHKNTVKILFGLIKYSNYKINHKHQLIKNKLKNMNVKVELGQVLKYIYGSSNSLSRSYMKILNKHDIPVYNQREMNIGIITHNCGGAIPNKQLISEIFYHYVNEVQKSEILIIGLQELVEMKSKNWSKILSNDNKEFLTPWVEVITGLFSDFHLLSHVSMLGLFLIVLVNKSAANLYDINVHELELIKLGKMNLANKGGIYLRFKINFEHIGVFNCHLAAGVKPKHYQRRQDNLLTLAKFLDTQPNLSISLIIGDMNFRTQLPCKDASELINNYIKAGTQEETMPHLLKLLSTDELTEFIDKTKGTSLENFVEPPIAFLPSYKWGIGKSVYNFEDSKKAPSWYSNKD